MEIPNACHPPLTTADPAPALSSLAFFRTSDQPRLRTPVPSTRFHFDPRFRTQPGAAATSPSPLAPFLTSWSCPNPTRPRSHRPVKNMPRVKSTQIPERSVSATPPASIALKVGSRARRGGKTSWVQGPGRRSPAPPRPPPSVLRRPPETEPEPGVGRKAGTQAPPPARRRLSRFPVLTLPSQFLSVSFLGLRGLDPAPVAPHSLLTPWVT